VFVDEFKPKAVHDEARIALSRKVEVVHDPAITALGAKFRHKVRVEVHFTDGSHEEEIREAPRGSEQSFAPADEIVEKFRKLTRFTMQSNQQNEVIGIVLGMEEVDDMGRLAQALQAR
jgi:aconitate decarboxylase